MCQNFTAVQMILVTLHYASVCRNIIDIKNVSCFFLMFFSIKCPKKKLTINLNPILPAFYTCSKNLVHDINDEVI